jgi:hypothetical protein
VSARRRPHLHLLLFSTLLGVTAAVWFVNLRPDAERAPEPEFPALQFDRAALPEGELADPFVGSAGVSGRVLDEAGAPLAQAAVHAWAGTRAAETASDAEGNFALEELPAGPLRLVVGVEGFQGALRDDLFLGDGERLALEFRLAPRAVPSPELLPAVGAGEPSVLSGRCVDGNTGGTWYRVHLEPQRATDPLLRSSIETAENGTGFFRFEAVPAGLYRVRVTAAGGPSRDALEFARAEDLLVPSRELTLRFDGVRIALRIHDARDAQVPLSRARVAVFWRPSGTEANAGAELLVARQRAEQSGRVALLPVPPGVLRLVASAPGFESAERELAVETSGPRETALGLRPR